MHFDVFTNSKYFGHEGMKQVWPNKMEMDKCTAFTLPFMKQKHCINGEKGWHGQNQQTTKEDHFHIK